MASEGSSTAAVTPAAPQPSRNQSGPPPGSGVLQLCIGTDAAGKLIGRRGARIHEVQVRSGTRVQIIDRGDETLVEVAGECANIEEALHLILSDLANNPVHRPAPDPRETVTAGPISVAVILPDALVEWISGPDGEASPFAISGLSVTVLGAWDVLGENKVRLKGALGNVFQGLRVLNEKLGRHARWASTGMYDMPWELCDVREEGDPADVFFSTENFRLRLREGTAKLLSGDTAQGTLLTQIQEDSGSAIRVQMKPETAGGLGNYSWIEIAGSFGAKLRALLEVASLLLLMEAPKAESSGTNSMLEMIMPTTGPCSVTSEDVWQLPGAQATVTAVERWKDKLVVSLRGRRRTCCSAALSLARMSERRAVEHERKHGPAPLLIDYLARWFGRGTSRTLQSFMAGVSDERKRRLSELQLPVMQIASCRPAHGGTASVKVGVVPDASTALARPNKDATAVDDSDKARDDRFTSAPENHGASGRDGMDGAREQHLVLPQENEGASVVSKRRRRMRLANPFGKDGHLQAVIDQDNITQDSVGSFDGVMTPIAADTLEVTNPIVDAQKELGLLSGYSDPESDSELRRSEEELRRANGFPQSPESDIEAPDLDCKNSLTAGDTAATTVSHGGIHADVANVDPPDPWNIIAEMGLPDGLMTAQDTDAPDSSEDVLWDRRQALLQKLDFL